MKALAPGDVIITPAVDRLSRDTTDLLNIAREMQRAGAGIRSLAEPYLALIREIGKLQVPRQIGNALLIGDESDAMLFKADDGVGDVRGFQGGDFLGE
jgi:hypothetical protein